MNSSIAPLEKITDPRLRSWHKHSALDQDRAAASQVHEAPIVSQAAGNLATQRLLRAGVIQPKLALSQPGDVYEQEADRVADRVVSSTSTPVLQRKCACGSNGGGCPRCQAGEGSAPPIVHKVLQSAGRALDEQTRAPYESALGRDFGDVQVHTGSLASDSARAVGAVAYTVGQHLVFRDEAFSPQSEQGRRLLAHELTHVAQQSPVLARAAEGEAFEPADFGGTEPASVQCDSEDNEGFPLLMRGAKRNAVGFAQKRLNAHLEQIILCLRGPCPSVPDLNKEFIQIQLTKLTEFPLNVDCKFGPNTEAATKILQARWLRRAIEWDGKIGPTTWDLVLLDPVTHTHPAPSPPGPPPPFSFPPLPPVPQPAKPFPPI